MNENRYSYDDALKVYKVLDKLHDQLQKNYTAIERAAKNLKGYDAADSLKKFSDYYMDMISMTISMAAGNIDIDIEDNIIGYPSVSRQRIDDTIDDGLQDAYDLHYK